jgi:flagellar hook protein FlgE
MSAFNIGLSGLNAASKDLDVTSNNIANAATVGFKQSRAEFSDVYATTAFGKASTQSGSGVNVQAVSQQFSQGNLDSTGNALDMAINGQGFFVLKPSQTSDNLVYTRGGAFQVNKDGYITNSQGQFLQGFPVNSITGSVTATALASTTNIRIPTTSGTPSATQDTGSQPGVSLSVNLNSADATLTAPFDVTNPNSYNSTTSVNVFDSLGNQHTVTYYFVKGTAVAGPPSIQPWSVYLSIDGYTDQGATTSAPTSGTLTTSVGTLNFDTSGRLITNSTDPNVSTMPTVQWTGVPGVADLGFTTDFGLNSTLTPTTQFSQTFTVQGLYQNGYAAGQLAGIDVSTSGLIRATYSNGQTSYLAKVALANFSNPQGLRQLGETNWQESLDSGVALAGEAGTGVLGLVKSGNLEQSNVDLTAEMVHLIVAQRDFQANAKSIDTASQINQTIINLR